MGGSRPSSRRISIASDPDDRFEASVHQVCRDQPSEWGVYPPGDCRDHSGLTKCWASTQELALIGPEKAPVERLLSNYHRGRRADDVSLQLGGGAEVLRIHLPKAPAVPHPADS